MKNKKPKISVLTVNKNGSKYLEETIHSIKNQTFKNFEHIIVDSESTDDSLEIIKKYPHIRYISEKDNGIAEGFHKAFQMSKGDYIMQMSVSDCYKSKDWFAECVKVLDENKDVSLVWGSGEIIDEKGNTKEIWAEKFLKILPPQKKDFFFYMLISYGYLPELNYCIRKEVFEKCLPDVSLPNYHLVYHNHINLNFNLKGYLPYYLPIIAHKGRVHSGQASEVLRLEYKKIYKDIRITQIKYLFNLITSKSIHSYRDGESNIIDKLSKKNFFKIIYKILKYLFINYYLKIKFYKF